MSVTDVLTSIQNSTAAVNAEKAKTTAGSSTMDQDSFLQLMMAQLKYQDPLDPMDNSQMLTQQAQLTQVSELQKLNQNNSFVQASNIIGKNVAFSDPYNSGNTVIGTVSSATVTSKGVTLSITGVSQDSEGNVIKDSDGNEVVTTADYSMSDVMSNSGAISIANPVTATSTTTDTETE
jgi:flagellar basal-body rod modification protein FlgD